MERRTPNELNGAHQAYKNDDLRRVAFHPRYKRDIYARVTPAKQPLPTIIGTHEYSCAPDTHPRRKPPNRQSKLRRTLALKRWQGFSRFSPWKKFNWCRVQATFTREAGIRDFKARSSKCNGLKKVKQRFHL